MLRQGRATCEGGGQGERQDWYTLSYESSARSLLLLANLLLLLFCLILMGPCTRSGRTRLGYEPVCVGLVQPLNFENKGLFKQDLKPVTGKVRRVSETQLSPRQHTNGLALLASDADSGKVLGGAAGSLDAAYLQSRLFAGLQCLLEPQQLELMLRLADKASSFPLPRLRNLGFSNSLCILTVLPMLTGRLTWSTSVRKCKCTTEEALGYCVFVCP